MDQWRTKQKKLQKIKMKQLERKIAAKKQRKQVSRASSHHPQTEYVQPPTTLAASTVKPVMEVPVHIARARNEQTAVGNELQSASQFESVDLVDVVNDGSDVVQATGGADTGMNAGASGSSAEETDVGFWADDLPDRVVDANGGAVVKTMPDGVVSGFSGLRREAYNFALSCPVYSSFSCEIYVFCGLRVFNRYFYGLCAHS